MCKICTLLVRINQLRDAQPVINDVGMAALAVLAVESAPPQKETIARLIENMLALPQRA
ncbi:hypothetical protein [Caballeronia mineralivorans]|jgi:hypothetical protein|uniref:hypothetical protein n=1 Tax=Caballeronia mineralivorans TaxID=2010198 RepID=UPI0023F4C0A6|nr:hypothetical protein [Caballeronia mineralivorans]MDB5784831.1 hypothetical protein [Caballeronia mineralivorans]